MPRPQILLLVMTLGACGGAKPVVRATTDTSGLISSVAPSAPTDSTLRLIVTSDARAYANAHLVTVAGLDSLLTALKAINGEVWYYREPRESGFTATQDSLVDSVLSAIGRHELPVRISGQPDFSDQAGKRRQSFAPDRP